MEKLTKYERTFAKRFGITAADVHKVRHNCYGTVYGLYNNYYLVEMTFSGYSKPEIYRALLRKLIDKCGILAA